MSTTECVCVCAAMLIEEHDIVMPILSVCLTIRPSHRGIVSK